MADDKVVAFRRGAAPVPPPEQPSMFLQQFGATHGGFELWLAHLKGCEPGHDVFVLLEHTGAVTPLMDVLPAMQHSDRQVFGRAFYKMLKALGPSDPRPVA